MKPSVQTSAAIDAIVLAGQSDQTLILRGRHVTADMMLSVDDTQWLMSIREGRINAVTSTPIVMPSATFELAACEAEWHQFWRPVPKPGSHDLFALLKRGALRLNGNLHPLMSNLFYFKFLLAAPRGNPR